jgi:HK97 family phage major capsid protein
MVHAEISEAVEEWRGGNPLVYGTCALAAEGCKYSGVCDKVGQPGGDGVDGTCKPEGVAVELCDAVMRIFDYLAYMGVDKPLTDAEQRAYTTAAGSALPIIPETTANQIIKKMYEVAPIIQRCRIFHVPGNFKFAVEDVNDDAELHTENAAITPAGDKLKSVSLTGYEIVKLVKASRASSEMALSAFEAYIVEVIAENIARKIERYIFSGTGANEPGGVKIAGKGTGGAYTDGKDQITVAKTASLTETDVISLYGLLGDGYERNAVWTMRKATLPTSP